MGSVESQKAVRAWFEAKHRRNEAVAANRSRRMMRPPLPPVEVPDLGPEPKQWMLVDAEGTYQGGGVYADTRDEAAQHFEDDLGDSIPVGWRVVRWSRTA
jgi:hypothetical protein